MALGSWKVAVKGSPLLFFAGKSSPMQQLSRNVVLRCIATPRRRAGNGLTVTTKRCDLFSNSDVFQDTAGCSFLLVEQSSLGDSNSAGSIFCSFNFGQCNWLEDTLLEVYVRDLNVYVLSWRCLCGSTTLENLDVLNYDGLHVFFLSIALTSVCSDIALLERGHGGISLLPDWPIPVWLVCSQVCVRVSLWLSRLSLKDGKNKWETDLKTGKILQAGNGCGSAAPVGWSKEIHIITVSTIKILRYKIPQDMM